MDNVYAVDLAIWVNGNSKLQNELDKQLAGFNAEISKLQKEVSSFHRKKVGSAEYWYRSGGKSGLWSYVCPAGRNPVKKIEIQIEKVRRRKNAAEEKLNQAIVKPLGGHLIIDLGRLEPSDGDVITLVELYEALREIRK